ncbi:hypothetical protein POVWA1_010130 [Plasmodium ovale wallikeri]|uniref:Uncharacterized protein n=1 Tax=Plasmodium ovale wallikeri TaxID=864142 RepID=A0A1A8YKJ4_PLAOA|nr:hypothetical protein POVWA1_010130 [Plasmodium ovale wallikeri]
MYLYKGSLHTYALRFASIKSDAHALPLPLLLALALPLPLPLVLALPLPLVLALALALAQFSFSLVFSVTTSVTPLCPTSTVPYASRFQ